MLYMRMMIERKNIYLIGILPIPMNFIGKMRLQGSCSKRMVNNQFVCPYFMWLCSSNDFFFSFYF
jgi:hypothetical protein